MEVVCDRLTLGKIRSGSIKMFFALRAAKHTIAVGEPDGVQSRFQGASNVAVPRAKLRIAIRARSQEVPLEATKDLFSCLCSGWGLEFSFRRGSRR